MDARAQKLALLEERKAKFAVLEAAKQEQLLKEAKDRAAAAKAREEEAQKSYEKSQALAAALRAAKEAQEQERKRKIFMIQKEEYWKKLQEEHKKKAEQSIKDFIAARVAAIKCKRETLRCAAKQKKEICEKANCHPMKRYLSPMALCHCKKLSPEKQLQIFSSWDSLREFEFECRSKPVAGS